MFFTNQCTTVIKAEKRIFGVDLSEHGCLYVFLYVQLNFRVDQQSHVTVLPAEFKSWKWWTDILRVIQLNKRSLKQCSRLTMLVQ